MKSKRKSTYKNYKRACMSDWTWTVTIYIRADGSVDPGTSPISTADNITYTLTDNIVGYVPEDTSAIVVERDDIVVNGAGYIVQGTGAFFACMRAAQNKSWKKRGVAGALQTNS
jgi:ribonucleotide monophosphatase NagD (HAD superfamily)